MTGPFGFVPAETSSGGQTLRQEPVQMNLPWVSPLSV
jgi:hypothetical protein